MKAEESQRITQLWELTVSYPGLNRDIANKNTSLVTLSAFLQRPNLLSAVNSSESLLPAALSLLRLQGGQLCHKATPALPSLSPSESGASRHGRGIVWIVITHPSVERSRAVLHRGDRDGKEHKGFSPGEILPMSNQSGEEQKEETGTRKLPLWDSSVERNGRRSLALGHSGARPAAGCLSSRAAGGSACGSALFSSCTRGGSGRGGPADRHRPGAWGRGGAGASQTCG